MATALFSLSGALGSRKVGSAALHGSRWTGSYNPSVKRRPAVAIALTNRVNKRNYAIRDRYLFPVTESQKMAQKLEEEQAEDTRIREEHKSARKALKMEIKRRSLRPTITQATPNVVYPDYEPVIQPTIPKSLNIAVIGPANAGKSTWTNRMCGSRVTPVSSKPQTTRERMCGVATIDSTQLVIYDTPGLLSDMDQKSIGRSITTSTWNSLDVADLALVFFDAVKTIDQTTRDLVSRLYAYQLRRAQDESMPSLKAILFLNKYDKYLEGKFRVDTKHPVADRFRHHFPELDDVFSKVLYGSALTGEGMTELTQVLMDEAVEREWEFSKETKTSLSQLDQTFEIIREKLFRHLNQEIPYQIVQENVGWTEDPNRGILRIDQKLFIRKESQRAILHGQMKGIIFEAERDLATAFGVKVQLNVNVVVRKDRVEPALSDAMVDFDL
jgi:GTP-binding protein Era